jgi:hypothetical protein
MINLVQKERLLYGNFDYDDDPNKLYDHNCLLNIFTNSFIPGGKKYITADIALLGSDRLVIMVWDGMRIVHIHVAEKSTGKDIEAKLRELAEIFHVPRNHIVFDNDGVGGYLESYLENAIPFVNNSSAKNNENYKNLKTQCFFKLANFINNNLIYCSDDRFKDEIIDELSVIAQISADSDDRKLQIIKKEDVKRKIGRSPDFADAVMMRMFFELLPDFQGQYNSWGSALESTNYDTLIIG